MKKNYVAAVDVLRIFCILAVVMIHTTTKSFEISGNRLMAVPMALVLNQLSRFAVPLFFMISGFVLELSYKPEAGYINYLVRRVQKIFIPFVVWSGIYYYFVYPNQQSSFIGSLGMGNASYQLYFIPTILVFYFLFPLLSRLYRILTNRAVLVLLTIIQIMFLYYDYTVRPLPYYYPFSIACLNFLPFIIGMIVFHNQEKLLKIIKERKIILAIGSLIAGGYIIWQGANRFWATGNYLAYYSQWRVSVMIYTLLAAAVMFHSFQTVKNDNLVKKMAELSFFVFFIHIIVLEMVWKNLVLPIAKDYGNFINQLWYVPAFFLVTAGMSFGIAYLIHKTPLSRLLG